MALVVASCGRQSTQPQPKKVKTTVVASQGDAQSLSFPARVVSDNKYNVAFKVAGRIASANFEEGATVKKGQLLAQLDPRDYSIAYDAAQAEYNQVKGEADRVIAMYNDGATTANNYDKAVYGLQQITAKLQHARDQLGETKLYAPVSGVVKTVYHRAGEVVGAGTPLIEIVDDSTPIVEIKIPAADYIRRSDFMAYTCSFDVYPDRVFTLQPVSFSSVANANQLYTVKLRFASNQSPLPSVGMATSVNIAMRGGDVDSSYQVPSTAIIGSGKQASVYVVGNDSIVHAVAVKVLSLSTDGTAKIESDTSLSGQRIISAGTSSIAVGAKVAPLAPTSETNVGGLL